MARRDDKFVSLLKQLQLEHSNNALSKPNSADAAFEYGRVSGFYQALMVVESRYLQLLTEEDKRE